MFTCRRSFSAIYYSSPRRFLFQSAINMGKNSKKSRTATPPEENLVLPAHSSAYTTPIIDTHTHISSTYSLYRSKYPQANHTTLFDFMRAMNNGKNVRSIVDVWCEAPVQKIWKELADSALTEQSRSDNWGGIDYWFVMGTHISFILDALTELKRHGQRFRCSPVSHYDNGVQFDRLTASTSMIVVMKLNYTTMTSNATCTRFTLPIASLIQA
jgi:hypothetical protein